MKGLPTLVQHIHLHSFVLCRKQEQTNTSINYCSLINH